MITVPEVVARLESQLDAEGSDRYTFDQDYKPAINYSVEWLQALFNKAFSENKLTEENLRELHRTVIYQTNSFSRIALDQPSLGFSIWSIVKINPEPIVFPEGSIVTPQTNAYSSVFRPDLSYVSSKYSADKLTFEQWEISSQNQFSSGNSLGGFKRYAYINPVNYNSGAYTAVSPEISIKPDVPSSFVSVTVLKYPKKINSISDDIEFPETLTNLVVEKAFNFVSTKQGDQTTAYSVSSREVQTLVQLML